MHGPLHAHAHAYMHTLTDSQALDELAVDACLNIRGCHDSDCMATPPTAVEAVPLGPGRGNWMVIVQNRLVVELDRVAY